MVDRPDTLEDFEITPEMITAGAVALRARDDLEMHEVTLALAELWAETVISAALVARQQTSRDRSSAE